MSLWSDIRESIAGTNHDFTRGSLNRSIFLLAVPMVLEMCMESLFGVVDVFFVARLGEAAVNTVGLTEGILTLVFAVAMGLAMATTATVARRIGEKDFKGASVAAWQSILLGLGVSAIVAFIGIVFAPQLLALMGASPQVLAMGPAYTRWTLSTVVVVVMLFILNAVFRGAGDAAIAMRVLWIGNAINIALDPCLIFGIGPFPEMGVMGAAVATSIGRGVAVLVQFYYLFGGKGRVTIRRPAMQVDFDAMVRMLRIARNGMFQYLIGTASWLALIRLMASFGPAPLAGYTIAIRVLIFAILPSWGLSNAAATLVGQNLGANLPERAEQSVWRTGVYNMIFLGAVALFFIFFAEAVISIITTDPPILRVAADCLRLVSYGYIFYAWGMVMEQAFNGAGDTLTPTIISLFCYWLWQIPLAWFLAVRSGWGPPGVFWAIMIAESTVAVVAMFAFRRGKWKLHKV